MEFSAVRVLLWREARDDLVRIDVGDGRPDLRKLRDRYERHEARVLEGRKAGRDPPGLFRMTAAAANYIGSAHLTSDVRQNLLI